MAALDLQPGQRVLEVGCGHGVLVSALCEQVGPGGRVDALDRSPTMIAATATRNRACVDEGRLRLHTARVQDVVLEPGSFHRIAAVRVRELWDDPVVLPRLADWLLPGGLVCAVVDGPDPGRTKKDASAAASAFGAAGFRDVVTTGLGEVAVVTARI